MTTKAAWKVLVAMWLGLVAWGVSDSISTGAPGFAVFGGPEDLDATGQWTARGFEADEAPDASEGGGRAPWLQLAMFRLAERGTETALLCAGQAPASEQPRTWTLRFHDGRTEQAWDLEPLRRQARERGTEPDEQRTERFAALPPGFVRRSELLELTFRVVSGSEGAAVQIDGAQRKDRLSNLDEQLPAMVVETGAPHALLWGSDLVVMARLTNEPADESLVATRNWWRERFVAERASDPQSLLAAAYTFVDAELATRLRVEHADWLGSRESIAAELLAGRWPEHGRDATRIPSGCEAFGDRTLALSAPSEQRDRLARKLPPEPALGRGDVWLLALAGLATALATFGRRAAHAPHRTISRVGLLVLWFSFDWIVFPAFAWLFAVVLLAAWRLRLPCGVAPLQRTLFAVAFAAAVGYALRITQWLPDIAWLDTFVVLGRTGAWLLMGAWLLHEPQRRARWIYGLFAVGLVTAQAAVAFGRFGVPPDVTRGIWLVASSTSFWLLLTFCVFGELPRARRRPEPEPTPATA